MQKKKKNPRQARTQQAWAGVICCPQAVRKRSRVGLNTFSCRIKPTQIVQDNLPYLKSNI